MSIDLKITNLKNGLSKMVNADGYSLLDVEKTFKTYEHAGFRVKIIRGRR
jgi:hypothetical protein